MISLNNLIVETCTTCPRSCCKRVYPLDSYELDRHRYRLQFALQTDPQFRTTLIQQLTEKALQFRTPKNAQQIDAFLKSLSHLQSQNVSDTFFEHLLKVSEVMSECVFYHNAQCIVNDIKPVVCKNFYCSKETNPHHDRPLLQEKILHHGFSVQEFLSLKIKTITLTQLTQRILLQNSLGGEFLEPLIIIFDKNSIAQQKETEQTISALNLIVPHVVRSAQLGEHGFEGLIQETVRMYHQAFTFKPSQITYLLVDIGDAELSKEPLSKDILRDYRLHLLEWFQLKIQVPSTK